MPTEDVAIIGFLAAVTIGLWVLVPRYWRGKGTQTAYRAYRSYVMFTRPAQRRLYRTAVVDAVAWTLLAAGASLYKRPHRGHRAARLTPLPSC